ncbi:hypothetical protein FACS189463_1480 [Bacteroidia bacterium]|nr:hypothetical protein FACS189463_1480 [Bacteroidia bacterium]
MNKKIFFLTAFLLAVFAVQAQTSQDSIAIANADWEVTPVEKGIVHKRKLFTELYGGAQYVNFIEVDMNEDYDTKVIVTQPLKITSEAAEENQAIVAINGSYYSEKTGAPASYYRVDKTLIDTTDNVELFRVTGALLIRKGKVNLMPWSKEIETAYGGNDGVVLASGPLLIYHDIVYDMSALPDHNFFTTKHPRSAIGITHDKKMLLVTVDGRLPGYATGVSISELTQLMKTLGCESALNLDGGRSTTLWSAKAAENGVLNSPAANKIFDPFGERTNANTIIVTAPKVSIEAMDAELGSNKQTTNDVLWVDAKKLSIEGMGWKEDIADYTRIPNHFKDTVTNNVWNLSRHSAGLAVHFFVTGTSFIETKWKLTENRYIAHMTPQGINGLDLYVKLNGKWQWSGIARPDKDGLDQKALIRKDFLPGKTYECMLYLPLYTGVSSVELGFSPQATITPATTTKKPLVFYGSSILQGCSASRSGMVFSSMLGRQFEIPVVNLGFSGNGLLEYYFGNILSEMDASVYILDCMPNMFRLTKEEVEKRVLTGVRKLRKNHPDTPIVLVEDRSYTHSDLAGKPVEYHNREGLQAAYKILKKETKGLYYVEGDQLLGDDNEAAVDGSHPSDLGMYRYYTVLKPVIAKALKK